MNKSTALFVFLLLLCIPASAPCIILKADTVWSGEISVNEDILIPEGITLTIKPGTAIHISASESTKTDPEYMSHLTEITVRGNLKAEGKKGAPIVFMISEGNLSGGWAGLIIDGGFAYLSSCRIQDADIALYVINGQVDIHDSILRKNRYGLIAQGNSARIEMINTLIKENDYGLFLLKGAEIKSTENHINGNRRRDIYSAGTGNCRPSAKEYITDAKDKKKTYGDEVLLGDTVWHGRVEINGLVRVPENSRLIIMPGTLIEFKKKDTNGDSIGENGLLIQGLIIAKGTIKNPIIFRSAEKNKKMGDWDAINIMNSDGAQNLIEYCQIEDAYRGLHFHFSNVAIKWSVLRNNYRGVQFQESTVEITGNHLYSNKSGIQARDSDVVFEGNELYDNNYGANYFRTRLNAADNRIFNNFNEGLRIREGVPVVEKNLVCGNRYGIMVSDSVYGSFSQNVISSNIESGMSLKGADNIEVDNNFIQANGFNGMSVQDSRVSIKGNHISENGERGIGIISFDGIITENNIVDNNIYAIGNEGERDVSAPMNWWDSADAAKIMYDKEDDPSKGKINYEPSSKKPFMFQWPLRTISDDTTWSGDIYVHETVDVLTGATLKIKPATRVMLAEGKGIRANGRILAEGKMEKRITFTSRPVKDKARPWDEILLQNAVDSRFSNSDFENASWAIHSHFTNLKVSGCSFKNNNGGIRFRSGPVEIRDSVFENNTVGIRAYRGNALITGNLIKNNAVGIFIREKGGGINIRRNNIFLNSDYNIRVGDFNDEDVEAPENYWGDGNPSEKIFDGRREPGIGIVNYKPYAESPFNLDVSGGK